MPTWKKDATEFIVKISYHETRGYQSYVPKPIMQILGEPKHIKYVVKGSKVEILAHKPQK